MGLMKSAVKMGVDERRPLSNNRMVNADQKENDGWSTSTRPLNYCDDRAKLALQGQPLIHFKPK